MINALITEINNSLEHWSLIRQDTFEAGACDGKYISAEHFTLPSHSEIFLFTTHQGSESLFSPRSHIHQHPWNWCIEEWLTLPLYGPRDFLRKIACEQAVHFLASEASRERTREGLSLSCLLSRGSRVTCCRSPKWRVYSQVIRKGNYQLQVDA